jgi:polar amino acid transport system permease protein
MVDATSGSEPSVEAGATPPRALRRPGRAPVTPATLALVVTGCILFLPAGVPAVLRYREARRAERAGDRRAARALAARARTWGWYSVSISLILAIIGFAVLVVTANRGAVYVTFLDPVVIARNFGYLLGGFAVNVELFLVGEVLILAWSLVVAVVRELPGRPAAPLRSLAVAYTDIFRGLPVLLVLLIIGLGLTRTGLPVVSHISDFQAALLALTLTYGAYISEVIRAGMHSVHASQSAAARSLGLSHLRTLRLVVLPQALRNMLPPLLNGFISLQKDTALVSILGVLDAVNRAQAVASYSASLAPYAGVALCYLVITVPLTRFTDYLIKKNRRATLAAAGG